MSNDNYPAGVTNSHPYFNPPREIATELECGADEALVIPSFTVKAHLNDLSDFLNRKSKGRMVDERTVEMLESIVSRVTTLQKAITEVEQEREYECPFKGEVDVEESEEAHWDCPVCGGDRTADTMPEERDPDYEYDHRGEGR
jgi:hypothetical protein